MQYHQSRDQLSASTRSQTDENDLNLSDLRLPLVSADTNDDSNSCSDGSSRSLQPPSPPTSSTSNSNSNSNSTSTSTSSNDVTTPCTDKKRRRNHIVPTQKQQQQQQPRTTAITFSPVREHSERSHHNHHHHNSGLKNRLSPRATTRNTLRNILRNYHTAPPASSSLSSLGSSSMSSSSRGGFDSDEDKYKQRPPSTTTTATTATTAAQKTLLCIRINLQVVLQAILLIGILILLWDFHSNKAVVNQQINQLQQERRSMLLQVNEIAKSSLRLHQKFSQVADKASNNNNNNNDDNASTIADDFPKEIMERLQQVHTTTNNNDATESRLIRKRMAEFQDQEKELNETVSFMRSKIQHFAKRRIQSAFGTGPITLVLELSLGDYKFQTGTPLSILLFVDETPHAVWTLLEQIQRKAWNGAQIGWEKDQHLDFFASQALTKRLHFPETSKHSNKAWTLCVKNSPNGAAMDMYLNIQSGREVDEQESCLGIVVDGGNAIRELLFETQHSEKVTVRRTYVKQTAIS